MHIEGAADHSAVGDSYEGILSGWGKDEGVAPLQTMRERYNVMPDGFCFGTLARACSEAGDGHLAEELIVELKRRSEGRHATWSPNMVDCAQLTQACSRASPPLPHLAVSLFYWLLLLYPHSARSSHPQQSQQQTSLLVSLLDACREDPSLSLQMVDKLLHLGVAIDTKTMGAVLKACCKGGDVGKAFRLLLDTTEDNTSTFKNAMIGPVDAQCYAIVINALLDAGDHDSARILGDTLAKLFTSIGGKDDDVVAFGTLLRVLCLTGDRERAMSLFFSRLQENKKVDSRCCHILLNACAEQGDLTMR